jgi:hypothetical protein
METNSFTIFAFNYLKLLNLNTHVKIGYALEFHFKIVILHWKYIYQISIKPFFKKVRLAPNTTWMWNYEVLKYHDTKCFELFWEPLTMVDFVMSVDYKLVLLTLNVMFVIVVYKVG